MDDKRLVANVDYSADSAARPEGSHSTGVVLDSPMVIAVFNFLYFFKVKDKVN